MNKKVRVVAIILVVVLILSMVATKLAPLAW